MVYYGILWFSMLYYSILCFFFFYGISYKSIGLLDSSSIRVWVLGGTVCSLQLEPGQQIGANEASNSRQNLLRVFDRPVRFGSPSQTHEIFQLHAKAFRTLRKGTQAPAVISENGKLALVWPPTY